MTDKKIRAGIYGGTGFTGAEMCRLLLNHPYVNGIFPTSREPEDFERANPNLRGSGLEYIHPEELKRKSLDVVFFCTPTGEAMNKAGEFLASGVKVIDLSADFRFKDARKFKEAHQQKHTRPELLREAVYGITEFNREQIRTANLVANPGCYVITAMLGLYPLLKAGMIDLRNIPIHATNGTTGASSKPEKGTMHARAFANTLSYNLEGHRHSWELEDVISEIAKEDCMVNFNTQHGNFARGIHVVSSPVVKPGFKPSRDELLNIFHYCYSQESFIGIVDFPKLAKGHAKEYDIYPQIRNVVGTNFCDISVDYDPTRGIVKVVSVTDNLIKGAAGSAIQNMNVMFGLPETSGLKAYAL